MFTGKFFKSSFIVILAIFISLGTIITAVAITKPSVITANGVNLRSKPSMNAEIISVLNKGDRVRVYSNEPGIESPQNDFYYVTVKKIDASEVGWVHRNYLADDVGQ